MHKKIKAYLLPLCLSSALLCGCSQTEKAETTAAAETTDTVETTADTTVQTTSDTTVQTRSDTVDTTDLQQENLTEEQQIQALLSTTSQFLIDYEVGMLMREHTDFSNSITQPVTLSDGKAYDIPYYAVVDGDVTTKTDLINKMKPIFTDEFADEMLLNLCESRGRTHYYFDDADNIYIAYADGGSLLGFDALYITSVDESDADAFILNMTAFGSAENWDYDDGDAIEDFTVTLKRTNKGLKIDKCDSTACMYITYLGNNIIFGSVPSNN